MHYGYARILVALDSMDGSLKLWSLSPIHDAIDSVKNCGIRCIIRLTLFEFYFNADDENGSLSAASSVSVESEEADHHLLTTPNSDVAFLKEKPVRLARELL
ncbi:hypothetical protein JRO89_XS13G0061900 [Xanthoceras sorbifolium]|uniref:Uncharacterized protein n=1 Tax=Xanthoceras sorbifolium TaxID=99658 RepID=A0ABQ8H6Y2_9ROSI|nr:hypothetical protein JRO89_XS13G0061900 [Xanthoceras sorbifolium]